MVKGEINPLHEQYKTPLTKVTQKTTYASPTKACALTFSSGSYLPHKKNVLSQENDTDHPNLKTQVMFDKANKY